MINALLATDQWGGMGHKGTLPWYVPEDLKNFQALTMNQIVVMGRKTWDDPKFPKPLKGRTCYVVTSRPSTLEYCAHSLDGSDVRKAVLDLEARNTEVLNPTNSKQVYIIGGPQVIMDCHSVLDYIYLTRIDGTYSTDVKINLTKLLAGFTPVNSSHAPGSKATFVKYENIFKRPAGSA